MEEILKQFAPITLDEMSGIRLMNRTDTKFVTTRPMLERLLQMACNDYYVQEIDHSHIAAYYTVYFDTPDCNMYTMHETGHTNRQKLRVRSYVDSHLNFLEVKTKNNRGRTKKKRVSLDDFNPDDSSQFSVVSPQFADFLHTNLRYDPTTLSRQLENRFSRITLVNKGKTERVTIDTGLRFHNFRSGLDTSLDQVVVIELKRDGNQPSPLLAMLRDLHIHAHGFSKYCMGTALSNPDVKQNRFKPKLHYVDRMIARDCNQ